MFGVGKSRAVAAAALGGLGALGAGLVGSGAYHYLVVGGGAVPAAFVSGTGVLLLLTVATLPAVGVPPSRYADVFLGALVGSLLLGAVATGQLLASGATPTVADHGPSLGFLAGVGALAGFATGIQTARVRELAVRARRAETTAYRISEERGRFAVLNETARDLLDAPDRETVAERLVEEGRVGLPGPFAGVWLNDPDRDRLVPAGTTATDPAWTPGQLWPGSEAMEAFERGAAATITGDEFPDVGTLYAVPMGRHGLLVVGASGEFDERARNLAEVYARTGQAAMDRIERERELERNNERLEAFASVVAHDLRNPLNVVQGRVDLFAETGDPSHVEAIGDAADRMETIVADVLELARDGETDVDAESVKLTDVVERAWRHVETREVDLDVGFLPSVQGDPDRLARLFENLFRNCVEHGSTSNRTSPDDGVEYGSTAPRSQAREDSVEHGGATVAVRVGMLDDEEGFFVEDDGPGIPPDERDAVFDEGFTGGDGTGIGLAIVSQIATAHGWTVAATAGEAGGARFEFRL